MKYCQIRNNDLYKCDLSSKRPGNIDVRKEFTYCPDCGNYIGYESGPDDPYLKPGTIIQVWNTHRHNRLVCYYRGGPIGYANYCVVGTEWDFAPDWAVCSVVNEDGAILYLSTLDAFTTPSPFSDRKYGCWRGSSPPYYELFAGICPDKTRYQGDNWKTSLRMRPKWVNSLLL